MMEMLLNMFPKHVFQKYWTFSIVKIAILCVCGRWLVYFLCCETEYFLKQCFSLFGNQREKEAERGEICCLLVNS